MVELSWSVDPGAGGLAKLDGLPYDTLKSNAAGYGTMRAGISRGLDRLGVRYSVHPAPRFLASLVPVDYRTEMPEAWRHLPHPGGTRWRRFCRATNVRPEPPEDPRTRPGVTRICIGTPDSWTWDGAGTRVGMTMWESSDLPTERNVWEPWLDAADVVLVPCEHNATIFRRHTRARVEVVHLGLDADAWPYQERSARRPNDPFTFVLAGQLSYRKGWVLAYFAFAKAFDLDPRVRLILKTSGRSEVLALDPRDRSQYQQRFVDPNVRAIRDYWSKRGMLELYRRADAFLWPTLGEGWGLPPREAVATGLPAITAQHTGQFDADRWAWGVVPTSLEGGTPALFGPWGYCGYWQRMGVDDLAAAMVDMRENHQAALWWTRDVARPHVTARSWTDVARDVLDVVQRREVLCA